MNFNFAIFRGLLAIQPFPDELIGELKKAFPDLEAIGYADALVLVGVFDIDVARKVYRDFNLRINGAKSQNFVQEG